MTKLEKLIEELCPNGVEYVEVGKFARVEKGKNKDRKCNLAYSITKSGLLPTDEYFKGAKVTSDDTSGYRIVKKNWFVYSPSRIDVGSINYLRDDIEVIVSPLNVVFSIDESVILPSYLLYYLSSRDGTWQIISSREGIEGTGRKLLPFEKFAKIIVPVPPLVIQQEIVDILDKFTEFNNTLEAELEARKKQYEFYRDSLLKFDIGGGSSDVKWRTIKEIAENLDSKRKPVTKGNRTSGIYPYYGASGIVDYVDDYLFDGDYLLVSEDGANLLSRSTPIAFSISGKNWVNNHAHILRFNSYVTRRFVEIYLNSISLEKYISTAAQPKLTQDNLNKISIPYPSFEEQTRIVNILDRFDKLCNDLTEGLPAEIEARRKQYEYYRDKLLTFTPVSR